MKHKKKPEHHNLNDLNHKTFVSNYGYNGWVNPESDKTESPGTSSNPDPDKDGDNDQPGPADND